MTGWKQQLIICVFLGSATIAAEEQTTTNRDAIPDHISTKDTRVDMNPIEALNLLKADWLLKDVRIGDKPIPSAYKNTVEHRRKEQFRANPKQNRPLRECIKPNSVIDQDVQDCINGLIEPRWNR